MSHCFLVPRFRGWNHILQPRPEERACARLEGRQQARSCQRPSFETLGAQRGAPGSSESDSLLMPMFSGPCETPRKYTNAGKEDPRLGARDCFLEILGEPSASVEPSKRPFNHPTSRLGLERTDALRSRNDFNDPFAELGDRRRQLLTAVNTVSENVTQLWKQHPDIFQQRYRAVNILNVGRVHLHRKQRAIRISDDVTFSPLHLLARIKPAWTATFRGLHALAVDNTSRGTALASARPARAFYKDTIDPPPNVAIAPIVKVMLNRRVRRKVFRQSTPLAAGRKHIENAIHDDAKGPGRRAAKVTPFRQKSTQQQPLLNRRIACIAQSNAAILFAGGFGPSHGLSLADSKPTKGIMRRGRNHPLFQGFLFIGQPFRTRLIDASIRFKLG